MEQKRHSKKTSDQVDSGRITHNDIARELGVSHTTVSLALRNNPRISEATRIRVEEKAKAMGYKPDPMLTALVHYRHAKNEHPATAALAWINPYRDPELLRAQKEFDLYWQGAENTAMRLGFRLEEFTTKSIPLARMNTVFKARNIRGIVIASLCSADLRDPSVDWKSFPWQDYAAVRLGRSMAYPEVHHATSSQVPNTILAFERMHEKGYKRIGYVGQHSPTRMFCAGVAHAQVYIPESCCIPPLLFAREETLQERKDMLKHWLEKNRPDAILSDWAEGLIQVLEEFGYRVPADLGLATTSIHDTTINAGIDQNPEEIGGAAVRTLASLLNENNFGIPEVGNEILVEGHWVDGAMLPDRN